MCMCEFRFPEGQKKLSGSLEAGVTGGSEPTTADSGNRLGPLKEPPVLFTADI